MFTARNIKVTAFVVIALTAITYSGQPAAATYDFCATMDGIYATAQSSAMAPILALLGDNAALIQLLQCSVADLNGPFVDTDDPPDGDGDLPGPNGMLDAAFELGVIAELLNNPTAHQGLASGTMAGQIAVGVNPTAVATAFNANYHAMYDPIVSTGLLDQLPNIVRLLTGIQLTPEQSTQISALFPNLLQVLAGYAVIGDDDSVAIVLFLTNALRNALASLGDLPSNPDDLVSLPAFLGPNGDADGDGYTNRQEYNAYAGAKDAGEYVAAALDPMINPSTTSTERVLLSPKGTVRMPAGWTLQIKAATNLTGTVAYQWLHNGEEIEFANDPTFIIQSLAYGDAGQYQCQVTNDAKTVLISLPLTVVVIDPSTVPLAGGLGLSALAGICALGGALVIRRKK